MLNHRPWLAAAAAAGLLGTTTLVTVAVPTDVHLPGTQPGEVTNLGAVSNCDNCHGGYDRDAEPSFTWRGSMMAHASRDPLFWATMAIAEQDFAGSGDLCLRCHTPRGWLEGRSTPTDGSAMTDADVDGLECAICHKMVNPDDSEWQGVQNAPFVANEGSPPVGYHGSGMMVLWNGRERFGPYANSTARHPSERSRFHRSPEFCGTCHDVSNPVVGDLAPGHGAQVPLEPGSFSGTPGTPVATKAAFNNFPHAYGVVERTFSEHMASAWPGTEVETFATLPPELQQGAVAAAFEAAQIAGLGGDYADGTDRYFTCQSCHMPPVEGKGCNKSNAPLRKDLPLHDLTGGNYWMPEAMEYLDARGRLRLGGGFSSGQIDALRSGARRARGQLELAAALTINGDTVRIVNLTGHKLISGYPEGRRMWLRVHWHDAAGRLVRTDGAYGAITATIDGQPTAVDTLLDPDDPNTFVYEAKPGITQEWAAKLLTLGVSPDLALAYDRRSGATTSTLGDLAAQPSGSALQTFHFVLNDTLLKDNRIPPWGMRYDEARTRGIEPVPAAQYGVPGPGGTYRHWSDVTLSPPPGAVHALAELLYQPTSWEYVQFLHLANDRSNTFLQDVGADLLDAWINTGMAAPHVMASAVWCRLPGTGEDLELRTTINGAGDPLACGKTARARDRLDISWRSPGATFVGAPSVLLLQAYPSIAPPPLSPFLPGFWTAGFQIQVPVAALPPASVSLPITLPSGPGLTVRVQAVAVSPLAATGFAMTDAHDVLLR